MTTRQHHRQRQVIRSWPLDTFSSPAAFGHWKKSSRMIYDHHTTGENDRHSSECQLFPREAFVSFILLFCISWILKSAQKLQGQALRRWLCPGHDIKRLKLASTASRSLRSRNDGRGSAVSAVVSSVLSSREVRVGKPRLASGPCAA
jgi:hypothetical protein